MFAKRDFVSCIEQQLTERGFGAQRKSEILDKFHGLTGMFRAQGEGEQISQAMAMSRVFDDLARDTRERAKRTAKMLEVQAENNTRIALGKSVDAHRWLMDGGSGKGAGIARAAIALLQNDPRFPGVSVEEVKRGLRGKYWATLFATESNQGFAKGAFGTQRNGSGLYDIVREMFSPGSTASAEAKAFAADYKALQRVMVDDRNKFGGSLQFLENYVPQKQNAASVTRTPIAEWKADMNNWLDWDRMTWPNGDAIKASERDGILNDIYRTFRSGGANKIDPKKFGGQGHALGNALDEHRFIHYKDGDSWIAMHEKYGDGNVFDVVTQHIESMAHTNALIKQFGPNPEMAMDNVRALVLKHAESVQDVDPDAVSQANKVLKNRLEPMWKQYTHGNALDPNDPIAAGVVATSNVLAGAQLGSAVFLAAPGDFATTLAMRMESHMPILKGMGTYLSAVTANYKELQKQSARLGFIYDNLVGGTYVTERYSPVATYGPQMSRVISDSMIRASGLNRHTEVARATAQYELMGNLWDARASKFDDVPFKHVMERYGIDANDWDAVRKAISPYSPAAGVEMFRPLDILDTTLANKDDLYAKFFGFVNRETDYRVPVASIEANSWLTSGQRPDTVLGMIGHSFKMYKNFPVTFWMQYGRMAMSQERTYNRIGFTAAIAAGALFVGALGVQMREVIKGKTPLPMTGPTFWGKAFLAGGGASVYGDFLFSGINEYGRGLGDVIAGPIGGLAHDVTNLALGDAFKYVQLADMDNAAAFKSNTLGRAVDLLKKNTPGTSLWWARLALEREVWDTLDELADPNIYRKRTAKIRRQEKNYGNTYWSRPGEGLFQ